MTDIAHIKISNKADFNRKTQNIIMIWLKIGESVRFQHI